MEAVPITKHRSPVRHYKVEHTAQDCYTVGYWFRDRDWPIARWFPMDDFPTKKEAEEWMLANVHES